MGDGFYPDYRNSDSNRTAVGNWLVVGFPIVEVRPKFVGLRRVGGVQQKQHTFYSNYLATFRPKKITVGRFVVQFGKPWGLAQPYKKFGPIYCGAV